MDRQADIYFKVRKSEGGRERQNEREEEVEEDEQETRLRTLVLT